MKQLSDLLKKDLDPDPEIHGITADSREVRAGFLFAALKGSALDGARFIPSALEAGAVAILTYEGAPIPAETDVTVITHPEPRLALAEMASRFHPGRPAFLAGVTGTNGKTSTAVFARQILSALGTRAGSLGTLGVDVEGEGAPWHCPLGHTTPEPVTLHRALSAAQQAGCSHMVMEVSSHGLAQYRADGLRFGAAAFTNITQDHLDYHKDFEDYFAAKKRLFTDLLEADGRIIINMDGAGAEDLMGASGITAANVITIGRAGRDLRVANIVSKAAGLDLIVEAYGQRYEVSVPLLGAFQAENALCAAGLVVAAGFPSDEVLPCLGDLTGVPGRMMQAGLCAGAGIYVDYAHTPDAVSTVLQAARAHAGGRLIAILGAGGDRDRTKRPLMGRAAAAHADIVILADDNPRSENPDEIRSDILQGAPAAKNIGDRETAIAEALGMLKSGDVLMILGKGHETGQTIGGETIPFDDVEVVRKLVGTGAG